MLTTGGRPAWAVAVTSAREPVDTLIRCIAATRTALAHAGCRFACIDVLVNGNRELADALVQWLGQQSPAIPDGHVRVWFIPLADKANAWNEYVHRIAPDASTVFFIDGYAEVAVDALDRLNHALTVAPDALACTGVPSSGRSAAALREDLLRDGGLHGNLFVLRGALLARLRERGFRLPRGLYRGDSLLNAALSFRLDPATHPWDRSSVVVCADATWHVASSGWWSAGAVAGRFRRLVRQAQGRLEVGALRQHMGLAKRSPLDLPATAIELVEHWVAQDPGAARALFRSHPLTRYARRQMHHHAAANSRAAATAELLGSSGPTQPLL